MLYGVFDSDILNQITYQTPCHAVFDYCDEKRVDKLSYDLERAMKAGKEGAPISAVKGSEKPGHQESYMVQIPSKSWQVLCMRKKKVKQRQTTFLNTVKRYTEICENKKDVDFGKEEVLLHPVKAGPFYAVGQLKDSHHPIGQSFKLLVTVSGLLIDENQQVLNEEYEPIEGLFATGNSSGCRFGFQYTTSVPGQSISMAETLGREVGKYVAKF